MAKNKVSSITHRFRKHYDTNNLGKNKVCVFYKRLMITNKSSNGTDPGVKEKC